MIYKLPAVANREITMWLIWVYTIDKNNSKSKSQITVHKLSILKNILEEVMTFFHFFQYLVMVLVAIQSLGGFNVIQFYGVLGTCLD